MLTTRRNRILSGNFICDTQTYTLDTHKETKAVITEVEDIEKETNSKTGIRDREKIRKAELLEKNNRCLLIEGSCNS